MNILVVGASGTTGKLLVKNLLEKGECVKVIVRNTATLPDEIMSHKNITIITANILNISTQELTSYVQGCNAVVSCLGHNLTFKGIYGSPHRLVTLAVKHLCLVIEKLSPFNKIKFILMNTTGNKNTLAHEKTSLMQSFVVGLIRYLIPPHADNEQAARFLQSEIGFHSESIQWVVVRPDSLTNETDIGPYTVHPSPIRSAIFDAGKTSRINVAHFMSQLIIDNATWYKWQGTMPVIYNQDCNNNI